MRHYILLIGCLLFISCGSTDSVRETVDFTSSWKFCLADEANAYQSAYDDSQWRTLDLPHDWSIEADFSKDNPATPGGGALPGGVGWYRKQFELNAEEREKTIYIDFDGIYWNSKVWINGQFLGERPNGYLSFRYDLTPYLHYDKPNQIAVRVDNSQQPNSRWYSGSGIYRNVWLVKVNSLHVDQWGTYITTPVVTDEFAELNIYTTIRNGELKSQQATLHSTLFDADSREISHVSSPITIEGDSNGEQMQAIKVSNPHLWSVESPYLYRVVTQIEQEGRIVDDYETTIGIRHFKFDKDSGFSLNDEALKIKGVCLHHDLGLLGSAVNRRAIERQLEILQEMGCNAIRTSHNPPAPELLELCDQMGFLVVDEIFDMWFKQKSPYDYSQYFAEWHERDLRDFIVRDRNHPSIIMWSIGNEILEQWTHVEADTMDLQQANMILNFANTLDQREEEMQQLHVNSILTIKLADLVRKYDSTRPVTTGNNETSPRNHLLRADAMEVIGFNYHEEDWLNFSDDFPDKKLYIAESTSALMSRGYYMMPSDTSFIWPISWDVPFDQPIHHCSSYDHCHVPWGSTHEKTWRLVKENDHIAGLFIWTGFDYLGEPTPFWWPSRSSYFGIVDLAGIPKDIYYMYQSEWSDKDVLHVFPHWNWEEGEEIDIWSYYNNADEVELFVNGDSWGRKSKPEGLFHVSWRVPFHEGAIEAVSYKDGAEVQRRKIETTGEPETIRLTADRERIKADSKELSYITVEVLDKDGRAVPTAENLIKFTILGEGTIEGTDNGDQTDPNSLKKHERHLFSGKAVAAVKSTQERGVITLTATSEGLKSATITIKTD